MPTFRAGGVTATLSVANLKDSLTNLKASANKETERVTSVLKAARKLEERVIGVDGTTKGVLHFIGQDEIWPLMMVEAGEDLQRDVSKDTNKPRVSLPNLETSLSSIDSPLTSLGSTPTLDTPLRSFVEGDRDKSDIGRPGRIVQLLPPPSFATPQRQGLDYPHAHPSAPTSWPSYPSALLHPRRQQQALRLTVKTSPKSHVRLGKQKALDIDLKIEVFLNGELAGIEFINTKRASLENERDFQGTRIHKNVEKPWVYDPEDPFTKRRQAQSRWQDVATSIAREATTRGDTPTAEYLAALSAVPLPARLGETGQLGVIDVLVSTGTGSKYPPVMGYMSKISRMDTMKPRSRKPAPQDEGNAEELPPKKKSKVNHEIHSVDQLNAPSSPAAHLAQVRTDLAIELGADPNGHLIDSISRSSPHKPPVIPSTRSSTADGSQAGSDGPYSQGSTEVAAPAPRKSRQSVAEERLGKEELEAFVLPETCQGSVVTYDADPDCQRQVARVRPGMFEEDQVVIGMRFVVV